MAANGGRAVSKSGSFAPLALLLSSLARGSTEAPLPDPGAFVERALSGGEEHGYSVRLERGQFLHLAIEQRGIDVITAVTDSAGREAVAVDSHLGVFGTETVCFLADRADLYQVTVRAFDPEVVPGRYELRTLALRSATAADRLRARAV